MQYHPSSITEQREKNHKTNIDFADRETYETSDKISLEWRMNHSANNDDNVREITDSKRQLSISSNYLHMRSIRGDTTRATHHHTKHTHRRTHSAKKTEFFFQRVMSGSNTNQLYVVGRTDQQKPCLPIFLYRIRRNEKTLFNMVGRTDQQKPCRIRFSFLFCRCCVSSMRPRYSSFRIDSIDRAMVLLPDDDVVMKRLFGWYCCIDAVN